MNQQSLSNHKGPKALIIPIILVVGFIGLIFAANKVPTYAPVQNDWTEPFPAFRIVGNLYYVGSKGLASYSIAHAGRSHSHQQQHGSERADDSHEHRVVRVQVQRRE